jgi:hypothetical protein
VALLPNVGSGLWHGRPHNPALFTTSAYRSVIKRGETVLALPFGNTGYSMLWQAETGMWFRLAGGYLGKLFPADYAREPITAALLDGRIAPKAEDLRAFLVRRHVGAVVVDSAKPQHWPAVLAGLGLRPEAIGGVLLYRVPRTL